MVSGGGYLGILGANWSFNCEHVKKRWHLVLNFLSPSQICPDIFVIVVVAADAQWDRSIGLSALPPK